MPLLPWEDEPAISEESNGLPTTRSLVVMDLPPIEYSVFTVQRYVYMHPFEIGAQ